MKAYKRTYRLNLRCTIHNCFFVKTPGKVVKFMINLGCEMLFALTGSVLYVDL